MEQDDLAVVYIIYVCTLYVFHGLNLVKTRVIGEQRKLFLIVQDRVLCTRYVVL